jgi:predicted RNA methylase
MLCFQYYGEWESFYVIDRQKLRDATVLDVGAGCGETAAFYFEKGAKKVICVESDPRCVYRHVKATAPATRIRVCGGLLTS